MQSLEVEMSFDVETITIDIEKLRKDMLNESYGAFAGGGFGGALMQALDLERASDEEVARMALQSGIDLTDYIID